METLINEYFEYCFKDDLKSERFLKLSEAEKENVTSAAKERLKKDVEKLIGRIEAKDPQLALTHTFHPSNHFYRKFFKEVTGIELPNGSTATYDAVANFVGKDKIDAIFKAKADQKRAEEEKKAAKEAERIEKLKQLIENDKPVTGDDLVDVARSLNIEIHPRTVGMLRKRVTSINSSQGMVRGKDTGDSPFNLYRQVRNAIQTTVGNPSSCQN